MMCDTLRRYGAIQLEELGKGGWRKCQMTVKNIDVIPGHGVQGAGSYRYVNQFNAQWAAEPGGGSVGSFLGGGDFETDIKWLCRHLWVVTNTDETNPGGPGNPIAGTERAPKMDASLLPSSVRQSLIDAGEAA
jgi:hypothetical protein